MRTPDTLVRWASLTVIFASVSVSSQESQQPQEAVEEIIITSSYTDQTANEVANPLHVVSGDTLAGEATQSLGETLDSLLGVASSDYGAATGQPIIRGLSGSRVKVLNNGTEVRDASALGADHINDVDLNSVQQIEVVRGPSSILYANGTIGGIINVVDNTIASEEVTEADVRFGLESQSANQGEAMNFFYRGNLAGVNLSLAIKDASFGNYDVPRGSVIDADDADAANIVNLINSDYESASQRFGLSKVGDWGHIGFSVNGIENTFGLPFHGEEAHGHEGEEEEMHDEEEEEHHEDRTFSTTTSETFNLEGRYELGGGALQGFEYSLRNSDYTLDEQHIEEGETTPDVSVVKNIVSTEIRTMLDFKSESLSQKLAFNLVEEEIFNSGAESYLNPTAAEEVSVGYYLNKDFDYLNVDFGIRYDSQNRTGSVTRRQEGVSHTDHYSLDTSNTSYALSLSSEINSGVGVSLGFSEVVRAPSAVELFNNGPHLATRRFEVGNPNLLSETSNNLDFVVGYEDEDFFGKLSLYRNDVANYIFIMDDLEGEEGHEHEEDEHGHDEPENLNGLILANFLQRDASFEGYELEFGKVFNLSQGSLVVTFGLDSVTGKFNDGSYVPRMIPDRNFFTVAYRENSFSAKAVLKAVDEQRQIGVGETVTSSYNLLDLSLTKSFRLSESTQLSVSLFGNNILNEAARNHTSFIKNEVPLPGANYGARLNLRF